jgi:hypothetical protein
MIVMFKYLSAAGDMLPPMTVYKGENMYKTWGQDGPLNSVFDVSPSGWFDRIRFNKWFDDVSIPTYPT